MNKFLVSIMLILCLSFSLTSQSVINQDNQMYTYEDELGLLG